MLINQEIWQKLLQWSRFRYINLLEDVVLGFEIKIITRELTIPQLPTAPVFFLSSDLKRTPAPV